MGYDRFAQKYFSPEDNEEKINMNWLYLRNLHDTMLIFKRGKLLHDDDMMFNALEQLKSDTKCKVQPEVSSAVETHLSNALKIMSMREYMGSNGKIYLRLDMNNKFYTELTKGYEILIMELNRIGLLTKLKDKTLAGMKV